MKVLLGNRTSCSVTTPLSVGRGKKGGKEGGREGTEEGRKGGREDCFLLTLHFVFLDGQDLCARQDVRAHGVAS